MARYDSAGRYNAGPSYGAFQQDRGHLPSHPGLRADRRRLWGIGDLAGAFKQLAGDAGIKMPTSWADFSKFSFKDAAGKLARTASKKLGLHAIRRLGGTKAAVKKTVGVGLESVGLMEGGPVGAVAGEIIEEAFTKIVDKLLPEAARGDMEWGDRDGKSLKHGDWVMIDNGEVTVRKEIKREAESAGMFAGIFQDMVVGDAGAELIREEDFTTGFVLGPSSETPGWWDVYNLGSGAEGEVGRAEKHNPRDLHVVGGATAAKLEGNEYLQVVKEAYLARATEAAYLAGGVVTDPGARVLYEGIEHDVLHANGPRLTIENAKHQTRVVDVSAVTPGRTSHNVSHNYGRNEFGQSVTDAYRASGGAQLGRRFSGQYVWVQARSWIPKRFGAGEDVELAVVHAVRGKILEVYCVLDGQYRRVSTSLTLDAGKIAGILGGGKRFQKFRDAAVSGIATGTLAPGKHGNVMDILGHGMMKPKSTFPTPGKVQTSEGTVAGKTRGAVLAAARPSAMAHQRAKLNDEAREFSALTRSSAKQQLTAGNDQVLDRRRSTTPSQQSTTQNVVLWVAALGALYVIAANGVGTQIFA